MQESSLKRPGVRPANATPAPSQNPAPAPVASAGELKVTIPSGAPVEYVRTEARKSAFASYTGYMAELDNQRNALRAWAAPASRRLRR